nr:uncharacterized protein LOC113812001 [Penaeus vannamei]
MALRYLVSLCLAGAVLADQSSHVSISLGGAPAVSHHSSSHHARPSYHHQPAYHHTLFHPNLSTTLLPLIIHSLPMNTSLLCQHVLPTQPNHGASRTLTIPPTRSNTQPSTTTRSSSPSMLTWPNSTPSCLWSDQTPWENLLCPSETAYVRPLRAQNTEDKWRVIVNNIDAHYQTLTQTVRIEECLTSADACPLVPDCYESKCLQKSIYTRFLVYDPYDHTIPLRHRDLQASSWCLSLGRLTI